MLLTAIAFAKFVAVVVEAHSAATLLPEMEIWAVNGKQRTFMFFLNCGWQLLVTESSFFTFDLTGAALQRSIVRLTYMND